MVFGERLVDGGGEVSPFLDSSRECEAMGSDRQNLGVSIGTRSRSWSPLRGFLKLPEANMGDRSGGEHTKQ